MIGGESNDALFRRLEERLNNAEPVPAPTPPPKIVEIADQLALHYGHVVVMVTEKDPDKDEETLRYAWRGGYYAARGMAERLRDIMRNDGGEDLEDE